MKKFLFLILLVSGLFAGSLQAAHVDYFLRLEGIDGEATDVRHPNEIQVLSYSWGISQAGTLGGTGGGSGKVSFSDMTFSTGINKASPKLMLACATGQPIRSATLVAHRPGGDTNNFFKVVMTDVYITSYQTGDAGAAGDPVPTDQFSVNFSRIKFEHFSVGGSVTSAEAVRPSVE